LTVSTIANRTTQMACNGSIQNFVFSFPIIETSDLEVILTDADGVDTILTETTDYIVSSVNDDYSDGGIVTTIATYTTGNTITIVRNVPLLQESDFTEGMPTLYETFEDGLDRLTMITQQLSDEHSRALTAPLSEPSTTDFTLPTQTDRANKYLAFDADGEPVVTSGTGESAVISTFAETLLDDTTAGEMRTTLELGSVSTLDVSTDGTLADNLDTEVPSEKAVKTYADTKMPKSDLLDEDDMASDSATKPASQQSIKAYVDTSISAVSVMPVGTIMGFPTETPPAGFLECDGSSLLRATYSDLFGVISDDYGAVDGTHFNIPDYRGQFLRGWANGQTTDPDRASRTDRGDTTTGDHVGTKQACGVEEHQHSDGKAPTSGGDDNFVGPYTHTTMDESLATQYDVGSYGGSETRPVNINVMWCIKY